MRSSGPLVTAAFALLSVALGACAAAPGPTTVSGADLVVPRAARGPVAQASPTSPPRLDLICTVDTDCPPSVGMVVFPSANGPERCTGTLVGPDLVLTAGHCVTGVPGRVGALGAETSAWFAFPKSGFYPARWHRISEVVALEDGKGEVLAQDHALLRLHEAPARPAVSMAAESPEIGGIVRIAFVTPDRIYSTQHILRTRLCRVTTSESAEATLGAEARRVGWLSDCPIEPGNSGAPVFDHAGQVRAVVHGGSHPFFRVGVTSPLPAP